MNRSRREFLKTAIGTPALLSLGAPVSALLARAASAADARKDTVLVALQLSGGNDGLNTVVPYADDAYARARTTLRLTGKDVLKIDDHVGFHPRMKGFARLLKEGRLAIVQGTGYPKSDRQHEKAMRDWHTARPEQSECPTGWLGRTSDTLCEGEATLAAGAFVGPIAMPLALNARKACVPSVRSAAELTCRAQAPQAGLPAAATGENPLADHVRAASQAARLSDRQIKAVLAGGRGNYPNLGLAQELRTVAELIRADVGIRVFLTELGGGGIGGFDNHAIQRDNHASVLEQLSESVAAFADDLARHNCLDRVVLVTFSEFGRTLSENGRHGTGHGAAAPMFVMGGRVRAGLIGKHPSLTDLDQDAPKHHTDFRQVYADLLDNWLGVDSKAVLGGTFTHPGLLRA